MDTLREQATTAIADIRWCSTSPHTVDQLAGLSDETERRRMDDRRTAAGIDGSSMGWNDPTAGSVTTIPDHYPPAEGILGLAASIETGTRRIHNMAQCVTYTRLDPMGWAQTATGKLASAAPVLDRLTYHLDDMAVELRRGDRDFGWVVRGVCDDAAVLRAKCEIIYGENSGRTVAVQKAPIRCETCAAHGVDADPMPGRRRCDRCDYFVRTHGVRPTAEVCEMFARAEAIGGRPRLSDAMVARAKLSGTKIKGRAIL